MSRLSDRILQIPHAAPFRWVDRVLAQDAAGRCVTVKVLSAGEPLIRNFERIPAALLIEALCQSALFLPGEGSPPGGRIVRLEDARVEGEVHPGDRLVVTATLLEQGSVGLKVGSVGEVEGRRVARTRALIVRDAWAGGRS